MREFFREYGLTAIEIIGALMLIGFFFKVFWGGGSLMAPIIDAWLTAWMG